LETDEKDFVHAIVSLLGQNWNLSATQSWPKTLLLCLE